MEASTQQPTEIKKHNVTGVIIIIVFLIVTVTLISLLFVFNVWPFSTALIYPLNPRTLEPQKSKAPLFVSDIDYLDWSTSTYTPTIRSEYFEFIKLVCDENKWGGFQPYNEAKLEAAGLKSPADCSRALEYIKHYEKFSPT